MLRIAGIVSILFLTKAVPAIACATSPPTPAPFSNWPLADRWNSQGVSDLRDQNYVCAQQDLSHAIPLYRNDVRNGRFRASVYLANALSQQAIALSKLGERRAAARNWKEAASLTVPAPYELNEANLRADRLFAIHRYKDAFELYRAFIGSELSGGELSVGEYENGAAVSIKRGIELALRGQYLDAARAFEKSPPSQAAYYLEGQTATIIRNYKWAYDAYVDELLAYLDLPATGSPYGNAFDRPAMLRLVALTQ